VPGKFQLYEIIYTAAFSNRGKKKGRKRKRKRGK